VTEHETYEVVFNPAARRGTNRLPLSAATAMFDTSPGPSPRIPCGSGSNSTRRWTPSGAPARGEYRAIYAIDDGQHRVSIVAVAHRRDAYRTP
jgi:mRNA-degrading endonuclease RelE of RelBE toxin-antitoxin system